MPEVKIYYYCDINNIPDDDAQDIMIFGDVKKSFINKYYKCVHTGIINQEYNEKKPDEFLREVIKTYNFVDNPIATKPQRRILKELKTHVGMGIGDVVLVKGRWYSISQREFKLVIGQ